MKGDVDRCAKGDVILTLRCERVRRHFLERPLTYIVQYHKNFILLKKNETAPYRQISLSDKSTYFFENFTQRFITRGAEIADSLTSLMLSHHYFRRTTLTITNDIIIHKIFPALMDP